MLEPPTSNPAIRLRALSLGAGVQSTALALMAAHGKVGPLPDCAIFAGTGWEPRAAWASAVEVDRAIRTGILDVRGDVFLHRSAVPLDEADRSTPEDAGQLDLWGNECEGLCGV
jgi:hypothetical protein